MKHLFFKVIRRILGLIIVSADQLFPPKRIKLDAEQQAHIKQSAASLVLYEFRACPFCIKVRRMIRRLDMPMETRNILKNALWHQELLENGGQRKVPCLRIEDTSGEYQWLYDSKAIIHYLEQRFIQQ